MEINTQKIIYKDAEKIIWYICPDEYTTFFYVKYDDESKERELVECRNSSINSIHVYGDSLFYVRNKYFFRINMKTLKIDFIDEEIQTSIIDKDDISIKYFENIIIGVKKVPTTENSYESTPVFFKVSPFSFEKEFLVHAIQESQSGKTEDFAGFLIDFNYHNDKLVWVVEKTHTYALFVYDMKSDTVKKISGWSLKRNQDFIPANEKEKDCIDAWIIEEISVKLDDKWIYVLKSEVSPPYTKSVYKINYDGTEEELITEETFYNKINNGADVL